MTKEEKREYNRHYYLKRQEELKTKSREHYKTAKAYRQMMYDHEKWKQYYTEHREEILAKKKARRKAKRLNNTIKQ